MPKSEKDIKIAGFGIACMDYIATAPDVDAAGYAEIQSYSVSGGGITGTSCAAAARLGASVSYIGRLGDDDVGEQILDSLTRENIDVTGVIRVAGGKSLFSWIRVDPISGERYIFSRRDREVDCPVELIDLEVARSADVILLDDHWKEGALHVADFAKSSGIPVICDLRLRPDNYDLMPFVECAIISIGYAQNVSTDGTERGALEGILKLGAASAVVTCGEKGAWYAEGDAVGFVPAFKVDTVDTTGAGDVFHGAFAVAFARGLKIKECTLFASAVAAIKCTGFGGRAAIPNINQTLNFLKERNIKLQYI